MGKPATYLSAMSRALDSLPVSRDEKDYLAKIAHRLGIAPDDEKRWSFLELFIEAARQLPPEEATNLLRDVRAALFKETAEQFAQWRRRTDERIAAMDREIKEGPEHG
ncbi:MAG: hypothetical protein ACYDDA_09270 [Acidiferrobacteraceae bacterium]